MDLGTDAADTTLAGIFEKRRDKAATHAFASPLWRNKQRDDIHRFTAELSAPFVGCVGISPQRSVGFGHDNEPQIGGIHDVLEDAAGIFCSSISANVLEEFTGERAKLIHVSRIGNSNLEWTHAHTRNSGCGLIDPRLFRHVVFFGPARLAGG